jgi:SAM-dependent methyltransferase
MKSRKEGYGYNERLFSGGLRSSLHFARFHWLSRELKRLKCPTRSLIELGCFDGKLLDFLPRRPTRYVGFDANWEGGLDLARARWKDTPDFSFSQASRPEEMSLSDGDVFEVAVAMETLEHVPPEMVDGYLSTIARHLDGYLFVTVPNEKGLVFLSKWLVKRGLSKDAEHYALAELANATLGRMNLVARNEHKGFDYETVIANIAQHFDVIRVSGHPFGFLPHSLCFGIGIVARSKTGSE